MASPLPLPDWPAQLRAQGRSMTWLAHLIGANRTHLADVAAGRKHASPELAERIAQALGAETPDRLASVRDYAAERARWRTVERNAIALVESIRDALDPDALRLTLDEQIEAVRYPE